MACGTYTIVVEKGGNVNAEKARWLASRPKPTIDSTVDDDGDTTLTIIFPPCPANVVSHVLR